MGNLVSKIRPEDEENSISPRLRVALLDLLEAYSYALDTESCRWDFAVSVRRLQKLGLKLADLRWLVKKGFVEHAREVTASGDDGRDFRSTGDLTFHKRSCFVLTDGGVLTCRSLQGASSVRNTPTEQFTDKVSLLTIKPVWDSAMRELQFRGKLVKRFRWHAQNQEIILDAFEEDEWPTVIDDPLPPKADHESKARLQDTIKALNRHQHTAGLIRFRGNGTGDGVRWESASEAEKLEQ